MEIVINDNRTIEEIQNEFSAEFPYLKIEFLSTTPDKKGMASKSDLFPRQKKLSAIQDKHSEGKLSLAPERTVREIRDELKEKYGLSSQIFRKFGNMWIETGLTDHWSLSLQNSEGHEISETFVKK